MDTTGYYTVEHVWEDCRLLYSGTCLGRLQTIIQWNMSWKTADYYTVEHVLKDCRLNIQAIIQWNVSWKTADSYTVKRVLEDCRLVLLYSGTCLKRLQTKYTGHYTVERILQDCRLARYRGMCLERLPDKLYSFQTGGVWWLTGSTILTCISFCHEYSIHIMLRVLYYKAGCPLQISQDRFSCTCGSCLWRPIQR